MSYTHSTADLGRKYAIVAELGQGGMSVVQLAAARGVGDVKKLVVLKSIRAELFGSDRVERMFMDEARLATRLSHPNIVQTYEVVLLGGRPVIVMEYLEGQSLSALRRRATEHGNFPLAMQLRILCGVLAGLDYAHDVSDYDGNPLGLIHRDVSPQNVFITYDGHAKVLDFGIAKTRVNQETTEAGELKGKLRYMSPEQMRGELQIDRRSDVFAAGVILWEALAGKRLWHGATDVDVFGAVLHTGIPAPSTVHPNVDPQLEAICMRALAREPESRYPTCGAMQAELEAVMDAASLRASSRDVSVFMQALFSDARARVRAAIEARLKQPDLAATLEPFPTSDRLSHSQLTALAGTNRPPARSSSPWLWSALVLLLLGASGGWFAWHRGLIEVHGASHVAAPPLPAVAVVTPPPFLELAGSEELPPVASTESEAVPEAPAKPGHAWRPRKTSSAPSSAAAPAPAPAAAAPSADRCASPFYVDETGIRRIRKECR